MTETIERTAELAPALRKLLDERLDGIDRVLHSASVPRGERVQVVEEVERQLLDMLAELPQLPTRRDVLQALAKLDPPEAYLTEEMLSRPVDNPESAPSTPRETPRKRHGWLAYLSLAMFLGTMLCLVAGAMGIATGSEILLLGGLLWAVIGALMTLFVSAIALGAVRGGTRIEIAFAVVATVGSAWVFATAASFGSGYLMGSEWIIIVAAALKDIPFTIALIWTATALLKKRA